MFQCMYAMILYAAAGQAEVPVKTPALTLSGDVKVVQVDKVVVMKEDVTVANLAVKPLEIRAKAGAFAYDWQTPDGVSASRKGPTLVVSRAPAGPVTIGVNMTFAAGEIKDGKVVITSVSEYQETTFHVGQPSPPVVPPVTPPVVPPVTPPVTPPVVPPAPVADKHGLVALARAELAKLPAAVQAHAGEVADNFDAVAGKLAATSGMTIDAANEVLKLKNRETIKDVQVRALWLPWFQAYDRHVGALNRKGLTSRDHYVEFYTEVAAGLRAK